jgi:hypothetical protein
MTIVEDTSDDELLGRRAHLLYMGIKIFEKINGGKEERGKNPRGWRSFLANQGSPFFKYTGQP